MCKPVYCLSPNKLHRSNSYGSLIITIKLKAKDNFHMATVLLLLLLFLLHSIINSLIKFAYPWNIYYKTQFENSVLIVIGVVSTSQVRAFIMLLLTVENQKYSFEAASNAIRSVLEN
jgi:hypothetical protein